MSTFWLNPVEEIIRDSLKREAKEFAKTLMASIKNLTPQSMKVSTSNMTQAQAQFKKIKKDPLRYVYDPDILTFWVSLLRIHILCF